MLDVNHEVLGSWGRYDAVPMKFGSHEVGCWGGDLSAKGKFVLSHCELHSVRLFIIGLNVADDTAICDLGALGYFVLVYEK